MVDTISQRQFPTPDPHTTTQISNSFTFNNIAKRVGESLPSPGGTRPLNCSSTLIGSNTGAHASAAHRLTHQRNGQSRFPRTMPGYPGLDGPRNMGAAAVDLDAVKEFGMTSKTYLWKHSLHFVRWYYFGMCF